MEFGIITVRSHQSSELNPNLLVNFKRNLVWTAYEPLKFNLFINILDSKNNQTTFK